MKTHPTADAKTSNSDVYETNTKANVALFLRQIKKKTEEQLQLEFKQRWEKMLQKKFEINEIPSYARDVYNAFMASIDAKEYFFNSKPLTKYHDAAVAVVCQNPPPDCPPSILTNISRIFTEEFHLWKCKKDIFMKENDLAIGIDLGTTNSSVSFFRNDGNFMIPDRNSKQVSTPSYVQYKGNETIVGESAQMNSFIYPRSTIFQSKRLIGRRFTDEKIKEDIKRWPFEVIFQDNLPHVRIDNQNVSPEVIAKEILVKLKKDAEHHLGGSVKHAVITVPAYFSQTHRQNIEHAGKLAGLNVLSILNEHSAAAVAHSLIQNDEKKINVIIYDLGGGTFNVSVLTIQDGVINEKSVGGDNHLGGEEIDKNMVEYCIKAFKAKHGIDLADGGRERGDIITGRIRRLQEICKKQKLNLSTDYSINLDLHGIYENKDLKLEIGREAFNRMNESIFKRTMDITKQALVNAKMEACDIDQVILAGGSTRIKRIRELLSKLFPSSRINLDISPEEVVARGAAIYAAMKKESTIATINNLRVSVENPSVIEMPKENRFLHDATPKLLRNETECNNKITLRKPVEDFMKYSPDNSLNITELAKQNETENDANLDVTMSNPNDEKENEGDLQNDEPLEETPLQSPVTLENHHNEIVGINDEDGYWNLLRRNLLFYLSPIQAFYGEYCLSKKIQVWLPYVAILFSLAIMFVFRPNSHPLPPYISTSPAPRSTTCCAGLPGLHNLNDIPLESPYLDLCNNKGVNLIIKYQMIENHRNNINVLCSETVTSIELHFKPRQMLTFENHLFSFKLFSEFKNLRNLKFISTEICLAKQKIMETSSSFIELKFPSVEVVTFKGIIDCPLVFETVSYHFKFPNLNELILECVSPVTKDYSSIQRIRNGSNDFSRIKCMGHKCKNFNNKAIEPNADFSISEKRCGYLG